jgi:hypothetical protein
VSKDEGGEALRSPEATGVPIYLYPEEERGRAALVLVVSIDRSALAKQWTRALGAEAESARDCK